MKRPWKVPFRKNRKLQSCLVLSLALHLLVIFGITPREQVTQYPVLPPIMLKFTKRPPPQRTLTRRQRPRERPLVRRPALQAAPVAAVPSRSHGVAPTAGIQVIGSAAADGGTAGSTGAASAGFPRSAHWAATARWGVARNAAGG